MQVIKVDENRFEKTLDFLCSGIMSKKERERVRDELYDHLMTKYEINLAVGMDEEKAVDEAINALGNRALLRENLSKVHSYFPALSVKKAMTLLLVGYLFMTVHINLFEGMQQITTALGSVIFLTALFCFRKVNKELNAAFFTRLGAEFVSSVNLAADPFLGGNPVINICFSVVQIILNVISWYLLFKGLKVLTKPYEELSQKPLRYTACTFFACVPAVISGVFALAITGGEKTNVNLTLDNIGWLVFPMFAVAIAGIVVTIQLFWRINKLLYASDHEYKVEDSASKKFFFALSAAALSFAMVIAGDLAYSFQKAEISPYSIEDFQMSDKEYHETCNNLKSYGIPEELVAKLPKSEIANFRGTVNANNLTDSEKITVGDPITEVGYISVFDREYRYVIENYIVRIKRGDRMYARALKRYTCTETPGSEKVNWYVDGISFLSNNYNNIFATYVPDYNYDGEDWIYNDDFLLILSEENGTLFKNEPLKIYNRSYKDVDVFPFRGIAGFEYDAKEGLEIIFATSYDVLQNQGMGQTKLEKLIHRKFPVVLQKRSVKDLMSFEETAHNYSIPGYDDYILSTWYHISWDEIEEQNEVYYDETSDIYADNESQNLEPTEIFDENGELAYN